MQALEVAHYIERAADFYQGVRLTRGDNTYRNSCALLAIHCAISYSDALRTALGASDLNGDDHRSAVDSLQRLLAARKLPDTTGLAQFRYLVSMKTFVSYGRKRLDSDELLRIATQTERYVNWITRTAAQLKLEGWTNDDQ